MLAPELTAVEPATYVKQCRKSGWRKPAGAVSCTRAKHLTRWGNPYAVGQALPAGGVVEDHEHAVYLYRMWLRDRPIEQAAIRRHLAGKILMCWCAPRQPCHVQDVIIPLINEGRRP